MRGGRHVAARKKIFRLGWLDRDAHSPLANPLVYSNMSQVEVTTTPRKRTRDSDSAFPFGYFKTQRTSLSPNKRNRNRSHELPTPSSKYRRTQRFTPQLRQASPKRSMFPSLSFDVDNALARFGCAHMAEDPLRKVYTASQVRCMMETVVEQVETHTHEQYVPILHTILADQYENLNNVNNEFVKRKMNRSSDCSYLS